MLSLPFYFVGGLAHILSTYFFVFKSQEYQKKQKRGQRVFQTISIGFSQACFMIHNTLHSFAYNAIYYYACFVECKSYHFMSSSYLLSFFID